MFYYSGSKRGFYTREINGDNIPSDAVEVSDAEHATLMEGQARGRTIVPDALGRPNLTGTAQPDVIASITAAINAERDRRIVNGGYQHNDHWWPSDVLSRSQQMSWALMGANLSPGLKAATLDGALIDVTPTLAQQLLAIAASSDAAHFEAAQKHIAALQASADPAQYNYSVGWPQIFSK